MINNYYAVIFTSTLVEDSVEYQNMALQMERLAKAQPGYIKIESVRNDIGITISYWENEQAILNWKSNVDHQLAQKLGREKWYASYKVEIAKIERSYTFNK